MPTFSSIPTVRDDFRCSLCRQKQAFHCEHDTPYRDRLLQINEQAQMTPMHSRRTNQRAGSVNSKITRQSNSTTNSHHQHGRETQNNTTTNNHSSPTKSHHSRYKQDTQNNSTYANPTPSIRTNEPTKKNKSCVIL